MTLPEQGGFDERLDEILWAVANHYDPDTTDPYPHVTVPEAKAAIRTLVLEEIIGEDVDPDNWGWRNWQGGAPKAINLILAEQRKKLEDTNGTK